MALQVWLPLNGTLENKGLSNVTVINGGATVDNNGKIGKCYSLTTGRYLGLDAPNVNNHKYSPISIALWFYPTQSDSTEHNIIGCWESGGCGIYMQNQKIGFSIYVNGYKICIMPSTITLNTWHHICATYDKTIMRLYIDGQEVNSMEVSGNITYNSTCPWQISGNPNPTSWGAGNVVGKLNDIRIYNHVLSPKEVKEISKGLILHYKLDGNDIGITIPRNGGLIPDGVELYDYIQSNGTQYIDTGYVPNNTSGIYLRAYCTTSGGNHQAIGCRQTSGDTRWWINYSTTLELSWNQWTATLTGYTNTWTEVEHNYMNSRSAKVNGTSYSVTYPTLANITYPAYLFNSCNQGNLGTGFTGRISNVKITEGTTIVRNFLPCTYLGEPGMWDTVENKFYRNQGTGQFTLGNKITLKECEYLQNDGTQYIDTGVYANKTTEIECKFDNLYYTTDINNSRTNFIFGAANAYTSNAFEFSANYGFSTYGTTSRYINFDTPQGVHTVLKKQAQTYLDGTLKGTSNSTTSFITPYTIKLFATIRNQNPLFTINGGTKIYYYKHINNGILVRDMVPVSYNGTPGLWDKVEWKFYANAGSGSFTLGPEKTVQQDISIFYDSSGYCNHGTITGTLTTNSDSPRYTNCTYFNGSSYITTPVGQLSWSNFEQLTISAWIKPTVTPSQYTGSIGIGHRSANAHKYFAISNYAGKFYAHIINGNYTNFNSGYTLPLNTWHHCVATLSGTTLKMYVDGELKSTQTISWNSAAIHSSPSFQIGIDLPGSAEIYKGYYSDARIYATALSEDDVKELYNTSAFVTNNGVFAEYELYEDNLSDVKKTGLLETANFYENGAESGYALDIDKTRVASNYIISEEFIEI